MNKMKMGISLGRNKISPGIIQYMIEVIGNPTTLINDKNVN